MTRTPDKYNVGEILRIIEEDFAPVTCLKCGAKPCERASECRTLPMWQKLNDMINSFLDSVTLADLLKTDIPGICVIK